MNNYILPVNSLAATNLHGNSKARCYFLESYGVIFERKVLKKEKIFKYY